MISKQKIHKLKRGFFRKHNKMAVFGKSIITVGWLILIFNILYFIEITRHRYDTNLSTHIIYPTDSPYLSRIIHESRISQTWIWPCTRKHTTVTKATYKLILIKAELHVHYHDQARMPYSPPKMEWVNVCSLRPEKAECISIESRWNQHSLYCKPLESIAGPILLWLLTRTG